MVACQYAGAGCDFRGPAKKMKDHQNDCSFRKEGEYADVVPTLQSVALAVIWNVNAMKKNAPDKQLWQRIVFF